MVNLIFEFFLKYFFLILLLFPLFELEETEFFFKYLQFLELSLEKILISFFVIKFFFKFFTFVDKIFDLAFDLSHNSLLYSLIILSLFLLNILYKFELILNGSIFFNSERLL